MEGCITANSLFQTQDGVVTALVNDQPDRRSFDFIREKHYISLHKKQQGGSRSGKTSDKVRTRIR